MPPEPTPSPAPDADLSRALLPNAGPPYASPRTVRWIELALLLAVAFGGSLYQTFWELIGHPLTTHPGAREWTYGTVHEVTALGVCAYILHKQGRTFRSIGLDWRWADAIYGLAILGFSLILNWVTHLVFYASGWFDSADRAAHAAAVAQMIGSRFTLSMLVFQVINAFYEELIVRAYLMTDLRFLTGSTVLAVAISALFQGSYHLYQGWEAALAATVGFATFSILYVRLRRITPLIFGHMFWDLYVVGIRVYWESRHPH